MTLLLRLPGLFVRADLAREHDVLDGRLAWNLVMEVLGRKLFSTYCFIPASVLATLRPIVIFPRR